MAVVMPILDAAKKSYHPTFRERLDDVCKVGRVFSVYPVAGLLEENHSSLRPTDFKFSYLSGRLLWRAMKVLRKKGITVDASTVFLNVADKNKKVDFRSADYIFAEVDVKNLLRRKTAMRLAKRGLYLKPGYLRIPFLMQKNQDDCSEWISDLCALMERMNSPAPSSSHKIPSPTPSTAPSVLKETESMFGIPELKIMHPKNPIIWYHGKG